MLTQGSELTAALSYTTIPRRVNNSVLQLPTQELFLQTRMCTQSHLINQTYCLSSTHLGICRSISKYKYIYTTTSKSLQISTSLLCKLSLFLLGAVVRFRAIGDTQLANERFATVVKYTIPLRIGGSWGRRTGRGTGSMVIANIGIRR